MQNIPSVIAMTSLIIHLSTIKFPRHSKITEEKTNRAQAYCAVCHNMCIKLFLKV